MPIKQTIEIGLSVVTLLGTILCPTGFSLPVQAVPDLPIEPSPALMAENSAIDDFQRVAQAEKATLVQYSLLEDSSGNSIFIWVIPPEGDIQFRQIELDSNPISQIVTEARQQILNLGFSRSAKINSFPALQELYRIVIQPIAEFLPQEPGSLVVFIPQGDLFLVPFAALQDEAGTYLVDRYAIATAPSIEALDLLHQRRQTVTGLAGDVLVVGNPTPPVVSSAPGVDSQPLSPLPRAQREAIEIAKLFHTEALIGDRATQSAILERMPSARIIHLATYNSADWTGEFPESIALSATKTDTGLLAADQIQALNLNAELVVLSSNSSALGQITGDGSIGIPRAFMVSGVPTVIASLWTIENNSTAVLMQEFYRQLQHDPHPAQAFRQAMLIVRENYPHPRDWAAFTVIGASQ
ncbi:MAG: CHAT domain-containing protein [Geitlerinemataceae cyanobacterium]